MGEARSEGAMPFEITTTVEAYLMPQDGQQAEATFLQHLQDPHDMYIIAYAFTLEPMIQHFLADAPDANLHIYIDSTQAAGHYESPLIDQLIAKGIEVTIGTSTAGSKFICHTKGVVCNDVPAAWCWEGSTNFSASAWSQVNTAMTFESQEYYDAFVRQFLNLRYFAWTTEKSLQKMKNPPAGALEPPPTMGNDPDSTVSSVLAGPAVTPSGQIDPQPPAAPRRKTPSRTKSSRTTRKTPVRKTPVRKAPVRKAPVRKKTARKKTARTRKRSA